VTFWLYDDDDDDEEEEEEEEEEGEEDDPFPEPVEEEDAEPADENVGITEYNDDDTGRGGGRRLGGRASGAGDGDGDGDGDDVDVLRWLGVRDWGRNFFGNSHREDETAAAMISGRRDSELIAAHAWNMGSIGLYGW
jgi:hypothetical protein